LQLICASVNFFKKAKIRGAAISLQQSCRPATIFKFLRRSDIGVPFGVINDDDSIDEIVVQVFQIYTQN